MIEIDPITARNAKKIDPYCTLDPIALLPPNCPYCLNCSKRELEVVPGRPLW